MDVLEKEQAAVPRREFDELGIPGRVGRHRELLHVLLPLREPPQGCREEGRSARGAQRRRSAQARLSSSIVSIYPLGGGRPVSEAISLKTETNRALRSKYRAYAS